MILLINLGRCAMLAWALYSLLLIFAPALLHRPPSQTAGILQFVLAYGVGYALDRLLGRLRRRRAGAGLATDPAPGDAGPV